MENRSSIMQIGSQNWKKVLYEGIKDLEIQVEPGKIENFSIHALELMKWNRKTNLTAITNPLEVAVKHFLDSCIPASIIPPDATLLDIGSGGGFPGIPLKILIPSLSVTLIDASRKKVSFLKHLIGILGLENIDAFHVRAEEYRPKHIVKHTHDVIISRALSSTVDFFQMARPLLSKDGIIIAMKGKVSRAELESLESLIQKNLGLSDGNEKRMMLRLNKYTLPYVKLERSLLTLKS